MTIFILGTVEDTAKNLDPRRLNKQILECQWMINMKEGRTKPSNHPAYKMYADYIDWVKLYQSCLKAFKKADFELCKKLSNEAELARPRFITKELCDNFKKRLYTKDPIYYSNYASYGKTEANYYYVDGQWLRYENGKKTVVENF